MMNFDKGTVGGTVAALEVSETTADAVQVTANNVVELTQRLPSHVSSILMSLTQLKLGAISIQLPNGKTYRFDSGKKGPDADVILHNWNPPERVLLGGSIGLAESYIDREWDSSDVTTFLELFSVNEALGNQFMTPAWFSNMIHRLRHWMNNNSKMGSKRNISAHYDLGNEFYRLWLDGTMTYSSALYRPNAISLEAAQNEKYRSLVRRTGIGENDHVLEIGCGWGGFAEYVVKNTGARVTGLTISQEQLEYGQERIFKAGLNEKVELKFQDYRDETGLYDKIASIEMFEAVGEKYWKSYFAKVHDCLNSGGRAGLQIITIADKNYKRYRARPDFIQHYVFPGGMLPSPSILSSLARETGLREEKPLIFALDYARTLAQWRENFWDKWAQISKLGFDDRFRRMWEFYLYYCEAGFKTKNTDVRQVFYTKD